MTITTAARLTPPTSAGSLARRTTVGVAIAVAALLAASLAVGALDIAVGASGPQSPFAAPALVGSTVVAGIGAAVAYAALSRLTGQPARHFVGVAITVFGLMLLPVAFVAPTMGVTPAGQVILATYHLLVAVPVSAAILGAFDR